MPPTTMRGIRLILSSLKTVPVVQNRKIYCVARRPSSRILSNGIDRQEPCSCSDRRSQFSSVRERNPFKILGIPPTSSYKTVKKRFIELALEHHPDVQGETKAESADDFIRLRRAFEDIQETHDGGSATRNKSHGTQMSDDEFQAWFYEETGHADVLFRLDLATRKEIAQVAAEQSQGGLDKGGMWELARQMQAEQENLKHNKDSILRRRGQESDSNPAKVGIETNESNGGSSTGDNGQRRRRKRR